MNCQSVGLERFHCITVYIAVMCVMLCYFRHSKLADEVLLESVHCSAEPNWFIPN